MSGREDLPNRILYKPTVCLNNIGDLHHNLKEITMMTIDLGFLKQFTTSSFNRMETHCMVHVECRSRTPRPFARVRPSRLIRAVPHRARAAGPTDINRFLDRAQNCLELLASLYEDLWLQTRQRK
ncbi:hypothetical protein EVAR_89704_1 [Eumeta japonica]|uniref:Uncharacterized protein n=1 Tax=Eumeta variegata TaxID=151549 RepID=A0A4C1WWQ8_EUMVA|nr:hypothetical protein EVAR_89704_1 [Eumeta japonica]